jgi:hypothetical protein
MAIFKVVGLVARVTDEGLKYLYQKTFVRAKDIDEAEVKAINLGLSAPEAAYYGEETNPYLASVH